MICTNRKAVVEEDLFLGVTEDPIMTKKYSFKEANSVKIKKEHMTSDMCWKLDVFDSLEVFSIKWSCCTP